MRAFQSPLIADIQNRKIGLVRISDVIYSSENYVWQLKELRKDKTISGVLLRIESPGGAVSPSQEIYREVLRFREENKPLVVSMGNVAASGGYYIACPAFKIFANPGTITGSIGVIFRFPQYYELLEKIGVKFETIKAGKYKDVGTPNREMSKPEREIIQKLIDDTHEQFISDILKGRKFDEDSLRSIADGSIYTGQQALKLNLVDSLGGFEEAASYLKKYLGLPEKAGFVEKRPHEAFWSDVLIEGAIRRIPVLNSFRQPTGVYYLFEAF
jgi:protease-4